MANTSQTLGSEQAVLDGLIEHSLTEFEDDTITKLRKFAFHSNTSLGRAVLPSVYNIGDRAFFGCKALESLSLPEVTSLSNGVFTGCDSLEMVSLPKALTLSTLSGGGAGPSGLDFTQKLTIVSSAFSNLHNMIHLILRSNEVCPLNNVNAFTNTPIGAGFGHIYVPADLVDTYKAASNWSSFASQIVALSAYPKAPEGSVKMSWAEIDADSSSLSIGDTKVISVGGKFVAVELVGKNKDDLANGQGKAKTTWMTIGCFEKQVMNPEQSTAGGYPEMPLCDYMENTLYPTLDSDLKSVIKEVSKSCRTKLPDNTITMNTKLWIPSFKEVGFTSANYVESSGCVYDGKFTNSSSRIKKVGSYGMGSVSNWWLRSAYSSNSFSIVNTSGASTIGGVLLEYGVVLGFCV